MQWNEFVAELQHVLTLLFPARSDGVILCQEAGISIDRIDFDEPAYTRWFHIIDESMKQENLDRLLIVASSRYPQNSSLNNAIAAWSKSRHIEGVPVVVARDVFEKSLVRDLANLDKRLAELEALIWCEFAKDKGAT